ncbi:hypothetical protein IWQ62_006718 [Dispira parvispora]|uniref:DinB-like domain-containing protein n=1 Tax=Dispira parvispora TaxID=1520584 RepID=A0A9W8AHG9_9FUNG|nr:hypothetical protein IWQ62_006718 [Dispira parvispora]
MTLDREGDQLIYSAVGILNQAIQFVQQPGLTDELYIRSSRLIPGSTIGKHVRHVCDHFRLLLQALPNPGASTEGLEGNPKIEIFYDKRQRQVPTESHTGVAEEQMRELVHTLRQFHEVCLVPLDTVVVVKAQIDSHSEHQISLPSTLRRELWFCTHHAIHHYAMIKTLSIEFEVPVTADFGVAPSTLQYNALQSSTTNE